MPPKDRKSLDPKYTVKIMHHAGRVVLDPDRRPVLAYREIPLVLSSKFEGWAMEAIRRQHSQITSNDFRARMPVNADGQTLRLMTANALSMRQSRFRENNRCLSWDQKAGSKAFQQYLWSRMTIEQHLNNSIEDMSDVEDKNELEQMRAPNKGKFGSRRRKRVAPANNEGKNGELDIDQPPAKRSRKVSHRKSDPKPPSSSSRASVPTLAASTLLMPADAAPFDAQSFSIPSADEMPEILAQPFFNPIMSPPPVLSANSLGPAIPASAVQSSPFDTLPLSIPPANEMPALLAPQYFNPIMSPPTVHLPNRLIPAMPESSFQSSFSEALPLSIPTDGETPAFFGSPFFDSVMSPPRAFFPSILEPIMPSSSFQTSPFDVLPLSIPSADESSALLGPPFFDPVISAPMNLSSNIPELNLPVSSCPYPASLPLDLSMPALSASLSAATSAPITETDHVDWTNELVAIEDFDFGNELPVDDQSNEIPFWQRVPEWNRF